MHRASRFILLLLSLPLGDARAQAEKKIDAGGHRLRMMIEGTGAPTVVLESGLGSGIDDWTTIRPEVAKFTRVVSYERAGLGQSEPGPKPRSAGRIAAELRKALANAEFDPPFVLVGHSAGGYFIRVFAHQYPKDVAGLVLIEPGAEGIVAWLEEKRPSLLKLEEQLANLLPEPMRNEMTGAARAETLKQVKAAWPLPKVPTKLLTGMKPQWPRDRDVLDEMLRLHKEMVKRTPGAEHVIGEKSGHFIHLEEPELVIGAIRGVVERARKVN